MELVPAVNIQIRIDLLMASMISCEIPMVDVDLDQGLSFD